VELKELYPNLCWIRSRKLLLGSYHQTELKKSSKCQKCQKAKKEVAEFPGNKITIYR
jgi:hypothetical protein